MSVNALAVTIFDDVHANSCQEYRWQIDDLAERLREPKTYPSKAACKLLKLAIFGEQRTEKGCLRHDSNVLQISGAEGDYDGGEVSLADAQMLLSEKSITAILYTSPSHTEAKPRWRVLAPLSRPYPPSERARFVAQLNGCLNGILAPESFNLSQSYYCGRVDGAPYAVAQVRGKCIDELAGLAEIYPPKQGKTKAERLDNLRSTDPVIAKLKERKLLLRTRTDGGADLICPFEADHSSPRAPGDCTYFPPHTGGFSQAHFKCLHSHCATRSDDDFFVAIGIEPKAYTGNGSAPASDSDVAGWPDPLPLIVSHERLPYPTEALPGLLGEAVREVQAFVQCPVALAACSALSVLSVAAQGLVDVQRRDGLSAPVSLFILVLAESGERKTTCDKIFSTVLDEWDAAQRESYRLRVAEHAAKMRAWAAIREGIEGAIRDAARKNKSTDKLSGELAEHERTQPAPLFVPSVTHGDITPEELARTLAIGWHSGAILSSEAGVIFGSHGMGSDSVMRNLSLLNILWDGGTVKVERKTSNSFTLAGARLSLGLAAQPDTVRAFFEATKGLARGSGFASRFLLAQPASTQGTRLYSEGGTLQKTQAYLERIRELLNTIPTINERGELKLTMLHLSPEAKTVWIKFHDDVEIELRANGDLVDVKDAASKCADQAARIAALLHVLEVGATGALSGENMQAAAKLAAWHLYEARYVLGEVALPKNLNNAAKLDTWLIRYCRENRKASISTRDIQRLGPNCIRDKLDLDHALSELAEASRAVVRIDGRQKRVMLNPQLLGGNHGAA